MFQRPSSAGGAAGSEEGGAGEDGTGASVGRRGEATLYMLREFDAETTGLLRPISRPVVWKTPEWWGLVEVL